MINIFRNLTAGVIALLMVATATASQSAQTITPEAQLAATLCRNPTEDAASEQLLNKNAQLVNGTLWNALVACALSAPHQKSPSKSIAILKLTLRVAERLNKPPLVANTYYYLGRAYSLMGDSENSIKAYETSRELFEQAGIESSLMYVLADLGALYLATEDYDRAQSYSERGLAIAGQLKLVNAQEPLGPIDYGRARSLHTLGQLDLIRGNHRHALNKLREAFASLEQLNSNGALYNIQLADVLIAQAKAYGEMGEHGRAFSYLTRAHQISRNSGDQNTLANIMSAQASLFLEQEDYAAAQKDFNASLSIYRSLPNTREEARVLLNLAVIEQREGREANALQLFNRSMEHAKTAKLIDVQMVAGEGLGIVLTAKRDFPNALLAINRSLELARRVDAKTREAELLWRAAQTYYAMQNYRESAALAEQALTLARSLQLPKLTYFVTATLGEAYAAEDNVELAITTLKEGINQVEELRDAVAGRREGRYLFFENKVGPYHTLVKLLTKQGKAFEALVYAERAKARVLLEAVRNNRTDLKDIYTESEKAQADSLINKLHAINQRIQSRSSGRPDDELQNELDAVQRELVMFQERLAAAYPELPLRAGPSKSLSQADLNSVLYANDVAYLEYVVHGDTVGVFIFRKSGLAIDSELKYVRLPGTTDELRRKVSEFHSALAARHPDYLPLGRELYRLLIAPAANELQKISTLCIIPDEFLWTLPFQALTTTRGNYVIQEQSLYYAPSLSVLKELTLRKRQQSSNDSLVAFGNPVIASDERLTANLHALPETEAEVAAIAKAVRTQVKKVLVGPYAEEKTFKALAPQYATIHLATHGLLDNRDPLNSYLLLTATDDDLVDDGLLHAREIMDMRLDADLAVLSACETGNGRVSPGEGMVGMSWAFLMAGTRSVVVSQWRVNSASTSLFMKGFYELLTEQRDPNRRDKSQALREASLRVLRDRRYRHPFYWAGFVLVSGN